MSTRSETTDTAAPNYAARVAAQWPNIVAALVGVSMVLAIHRNSPRTLLSAHGLLHSAILQRFLSADGFGFSPENPFFAGEPLNYYWFYQSLAAGISSGLGLDPLHSFELLLCFAIVALVACAAALSLRLYKSALLGALIAFLVVAGANAQAPLLLVYRALRIGTSVFDERPEYLWGIVHHLSAYIRYADPFGMHGPLINFFLNVTARPLALSSVVGVLLAFHVAVSRPSLRRLATLALAVALTSALSALVGIAIAGSLTAALLLLRLAARTRWASALNIGLEDAAAARLTGALVLGIVLASPTYLQLFSAGGRGSAVAEAGLEGIIGELVMLLAACWLTLGLALAGVGALRKRFPALPGASGDARRFLLILVTAALGLIGGSAIVSLPVGNQDNFFHVALVILAVAAPAAAIGRDGAVQATRSWAIALAFLPVTAIVLYCYVGRAPLPLGFDGDVIVHTDADRGRLYAFIRAELPDDAVFIIDNTTADVAMSGNTAELPALTGRMLFVVRDNHYVVKSYPDLSRRTRIAEQIFEGTALSDDDNSYLAALSRPIYVVDYHARDAEPARKRALRDGAPIFQSGDVSLQHVALASGARESL